MWGVTVFVVSRLVVYVNILASLRDVRQHLNRISDLLICGNKMPTRCNRGFYCRSYCLFNMFRPPLCPSPGAQEYYTVVAACGIWCCKDVKIICKFGRICVLSIKCRVLSRCVIRCVECRGGACGCLW